MKDGYVSSTFSEMLQQKYPEANNLQVANFVCLLIDYLDEKGIINMIDLSEFLESRILLDKMQHKDKQDED